MHIILLWSVAKDWLQTWLQACQCLKSKKEKIVIRFKAPKWKKLLIRKQFFVVSLMDALHSHDIYTKRFHGNFLAMPLTGSGGQNNMCVTFTACSIIQGHLTGTKYLKDSDNFHRSCSYTEVVRQITSVQCGTLNFHSP